MEVPREIARKRLTPSAGGGTNRILYNILSPQILCSRALSTDFETILSSCKNFEGAMAEAKGPTGANTFH